MPYIKQQRKETKKKKKQTNKTKQKTKQNNNKKQTQKQKNESKQNKKRGWREGERSELWIHHFIWLMYENV